jgi:predicted acetyltransferase
MMLKLISATLDRREAFLRMAREWRESGQDRYARALQDFAAHVERIRQFEDPTRTPEGCVPGTELWVEEGEEIVACVRLRSRLTPAFAHEGGNIGYDVRPTARGRGVGTWVLCNVLPQAQRWGLERVLLTVDADNQPSIRIIEKCGGVLSSEGVSEVSSKPILRYWIDLAP